MSISQVIQTISTAIENIEKFVGLKESTDDSTVVGRVNSILYPIVETSLIFNNRFITNNVPEYIGSWVVNGYCTIYDAIEDIRYEESNVVYDVENNEWLLISPTLDYEGMEVTVTFYYKKSLL